MTADYVFVPARGFFSLCGDGSELGRVKEDHVEGTILIAEFAQKLKNIAFERSMMRSIKMIPVRRHPAVRWRPI